MSAALWEALAGRAIRDRSAPSLSSVGLDGDVYPFGDAGNSGNTANQPEELRVRRVPALKLP